jgi:hypothetical protein
LAALITRRVAGKPGEPEDIGMTHVLQDASDHQGNDVVAEQHLGSCLPPPECAQEDQQEQHFRQRQQRRDLDDQRMAQNRHDQLRGVCGGETDLSDWGEE